MSNPESLLVDMDGVLADTMGGVFDLLDDDHAHEDVYDYWFDGLDKKSIIEALRSDGLYRHLDVITGAVRGVNRLREEFNGNVYVCSAPMSGAEHCETEKREWLEEHFDAEFAMQAIITADKTTVPGRLIIEDNPDVAGGMWRPVMFDQAWNRHVDYPRMYGWHDLQVVRDEYQRATR